MADVEVRADERALIVCGRTIALGARAFDLFDILLEKRDRTVTKAELIDRVWANVIVEDNNLQVQISTLRKVLGARAIATIPGRGYKLVLPLGPAALADAATRGTTAEASSSAGLALSPTNLPSHLAPLFGRSGARR